MTELREIGHWIGGKPVSGNPTRFGEVFDPATGRVSGRVGFASSDDVDVATSAWSV